MQKIYRYYLFYSKTILTSGKRKLRGLLKAERQWKQITNSPVCSQPWQQRPRILKWFQSLYCRGLFSARGTPPQTPPLRTKARGRPGSALPSPPPLGRTRVAASALGRRPEAPWTDRRCPPPAGGCAHSTGTPEEFTFQSLWNQTCKDLTRGTGSNGTGCVFQTPPTVTGSPEEESTSSRDPQAHPDELPAGQRLRADDLHNHARRELRPRRLGLLRGTALLTARCSSGRKGPERTITLSRLTLGPLYTDITVS